MELVRAFNIDDEMRVSKYTTECYDITIITLNDKLNQVTTESKKFLYPKIDICLNDGNYEILFDYSFITTKIEQQSRLIESINKATEFVQNELIPYLDNIL
jgi:hypothetical protein